MKKISILISVVVFGIILSVGSCKHVPFLPENIFIDSAALDPGHPCSPDSVYFANDILPLIISNCSKSGCHDSFAMKEDVRLTSFDDIIKIVKPYNPNESKLYRIIAVVKLEDQMPPEGSTPLTQEQKEQIKKWIQQGALNNSCGGGYCDISDVRYSTIISPIINTNCKGCHSGDEPGGDYDFSTIADLREVALNGKLHGAIHHLTDFEPMPQGGMLSSCDIKRIDVWINDNAPDN